MRTTEPASSGADDDIAVRAVFLRQVDAMTTGDTRVLDEILEPGFVLTHMTGYPQPKTEWLAQMRAGQFVYHRIDIVEITTDVMNDEAQLVARLETDASVHGSRHVWPLRLEQRYRLRDAAWSTASSRASTW